MNNKEHIGENPDGIDFAYAYPTEMIVGGDGTEQTILEVVGSSDEAIQQLKEGIEDITGAEVKDVSNTHSSRSFGFSNWNAPWSPEGPKKNWGYQPPLSDLSMN